MNDRYIFRHKQVGTHELTCNRITITKTVHIKHTRIHNRWRLLHSPLFSLLVSPSSSFTPNMSQQTPKSVHDFTVKDIRGNEVSLSSYKGKVLLIVNVASKCGLTESNYKELNILYQKYKDQDFEILAFPCNQFLRQEPGTNEEIQETVCTKFKAEFPIFDKIDVNGNNAAPLYKFLKSEKGGFLVDGIKWNFTKFLVDREGKVIQRYGPRTPPLEFEKDIQDLLSSSSS